MIFKNFYSSVIIIVILFYGCLSFGFKNELEVNTIKKMAMDNAKTANEFLESYDYAKALDYFKKVLDENIMIDYTEGIIKSYADLGKVYTLIKDFDNALLYFNKALKLIEEEKGFDNEKGNVLNGIGEVYYQLKDYENAKEHFRQARKINKNLENRAIILLNQAKIDRIENRFDRALQRLKIAGSLFEILRKQHNLNNEKNLSLTYYSIGQTYSKLNNSSMAFGYIKKALETDKILENSSGIADDYYAIGMLEEKFNKNISESLKYYERSRDIYKILNNIDQFIELSNKIAEINFVQGNYKDFFVNKENVYILSNIEMKKKTAEDMLELLNSNNDIKIKIKDNEYKELVDFFSKEIK